MMAICNDQTFKVLEHTSEDYLDKHFKLSVMRKIFTHLIE